MHDLDPDNWDAWPPARVAELFAGVDAPWCVAAGWAIELFLGDRSREHEDLEVAVPRARFDEFAVRLHGHEIYVPLGEGRGFASFDPDSESQQTWVREPDGPWRLDLFREPADGDTWVCRRDESIRLGYDELIERTTDGIPYMRPDMVLLFKAKHAREKDEGDFDAALPRLDARQRASLRGWLERVHPDHRWLARL